MAFVVNGFDRDFRLEMNSFNFRWFLLDFLLILFVRFLSLLGTNRLFGGRMRIETIIYQTLYPPPAIGLVTYSAWGIRLDWVAGTHASCG